MSIIEKAVDKMMGKLESSAKDSPKVKDPDPDLGSSPPPEAQQVEALAADGLQDARPAQAPATEREA